VKGRPIDFGIYINADEIARQLTKAPLSLNSYDVKTTNSEFRRMALQSGLIGDRFSQDVFEKSYTLRSNHIRLKDTTSLTPLAQIIADFLRRKLLAAEKKFSFETVFSHESKLDIMRDALNAGYKVYLYFVCTDSGRYQCITGSITRPGRRT
jgi:predicted ABC-type ATPase